QVYMGALAMFVILAEVLLLPGRHMTLSATTMCSVLFYAIAASVAPAVATVLTTVAAAVLGFVLFRRQGRSLPVAHEDSPFHAGFVGFGLAVILVPLPARLFYETFLRMDFSHARISVVLLLPLATLVAYWLDARTTLLVSWSLVQRAVTYVAAFTVALLT